jgi:hypothetical protein
MPGESAGQQAERKRRNLEDLREQRRLLDERIQREERAVEMWERGHAGEQTVGAQLDLLRPHGFDVFHDVHWPGRQRANIDHVAVGPPGILVVDAKNWSGFVTVRDGVLLQKGRTRDGQIAGAQKAAQDVGALLPLPWALHVIPVIALAGGDSSNVDQCQGVTVVGHDQLIAWATGLPPQLTAGDVAGIASQLRSAMPPASVPRPRRTRNSIRPRTPREPSARQRKRAAKHKADLKHVALRTLVCILLLLSAPALYKWWESHGDGVVRAVIPTPSVAAVTSTPAVSPPVFTSCKGLRVAYPGGVKRASATNTGKKARGHVVVGDAVYRANKSLDHDKDGIACERTQSTVHHHG